MKKDALDALLDTLNDPTITRSDALNKLKEFVDQNDLSTEEFKTELNNLRRRFNLLEADVMATEKSQINDLESKVWGLIRNKIIAGASFLAIMLALMGYSSFLDVLKFEEADKKRESVLQKIKSVESQMKGFDSKISEIKKEIEAFDEVVQQADASLKKVSVVDERIKSMLDNWRNLDIQLEKMETRSTEYILKQYTSINDESAKIKEIHVALKSSSDSLNRNIENQFERIDKLKSQLSDLSLEIETKNENIQSTLVVQEQLKNNKKNKIPSDGWVYFGYLQNGDSSKPSWGYTNFKVVQGGNGDSYPKIGMKIEFIQQSVNVRSQYPALGLLGYNFGSVKGVLTANNVITVVRKWGKA